MIINLRVDYISSFFICNLVHYGRQLEGLYEFI